MGINTGGGLFCWDGKALEQIDTLSSTGLAVTKGRLGRLLWSTGHAGSVGELLLYDARGIRSYVRVDDLWEPHDLHFDGDECIAVSTRSNELLWLSGSGEVTRRWKADGDGDAWHLNGVVHAEGRWYGCAFGRFPRHRDWHGGRAAGKGVVFDVETGEDVVAGLSYPHDPRRVDDRWLVCNSAPGELVAASAATGKIEERVQLRGWTRGLAIGDDTIYVGESAHRDSAAQQVGHATLAILDRQTFELLERVELPCEEIFDVLEAPADLVEGARRGFRTSRERVAEQDQLGLFAEAGVRPRRLWATGEPLRPEDCRITLTAELPQELGADTVHQLESTVTNRGAALLVTAPPNPVHISSRWLDGNGGKAIEGERTPLPQALPPGASLEAPFIVRTPQTPGTYRLLLTLVQEEVVWFDHVDPDNALVATVQVV
jgi:hypothetical protein